MFILIFVFASVIETLIFAFLIHVTYRGVYGWWQYRRIGPFEAILVAALTYPGFAGCVKEWVAVGMPLPLLQGVPLDFAYDSKYCGWAAMLPHDDANAIIPWLLILLFGTSRLSEEAIKKQHERYLAVIDSIPKLNPPNSYDDLVR